MGDRYLIDVTCPICGRHEEELQYYAPTCEITEFTCDCGHVIDPAVYTGIGYKEASNKDLIESIIEGFENK